MTNAINAFVLQEFRLHTATSAAEVARIVATFSGGIEPAVPLLTSIDDHRDVATVRGLHPGETSDGNLGNARRSSDSSSVVGEDPLDPDAVTQVAGPDLFDGRDRACGLLVGQHHGVRAAAVIIRRHLFLPVQPGAVTADRRSGAGAGQAGCFFRPVA